MRKSVQDISRDADNRATKRAKHIGSQCRANGIQPYGKREVCCQCLPSIIDKNTYNDKYNQLIILSGTHPIHIFGIPFFLTVPTNIHYNAVL
jgi:hypothetical protein